MKKYLIIVHTRVRETFLHLDVAYLISLIGMQTGTSLYLVMLLCQALPLLWFNELIRSCMEKFML